jgi:hypothetical protein
MANGFLAGCSLPTISAEQVWKLLSDEGWRNSCFSLKSDTALNLLAAGLRLIQMREDGKWAEQVPLMWARAADDSRLESDRRRQCVTFAILAAAASGTAAALRHLRCDKDSLVSAEVEAWRGRLQQRINGAPRWTAGRLRDLLSQLA